MSALSLQFWTLEVQNQGVVRATFPLVPLQLLVGAIIPQGSLDCSCIASGSPCIQSTGFSPAAAGSLLEIQILSHLPSTCPLSRSADDEWVHKSEKCCSEPPPAAFEGRIGRGPGGLCPWARRCGSQALHSVTMLRHAFGLGNGPPPLQCQPIGLP